MTPRHSIRIIPRLDIKGPHVVKGIRLEGLRVLGRPEQFVRCYIEQGADELLYQDVVASLYGRNTLLDVVARTAEEVSIPLTVGGGIRSISDIGALLRVGADKVAINTAAIRRPEFVTEAAETFGSSTVVVAIEAIRGRDGRYSAFTDNGREDAGVDAVEWAARAAELGAGELVVTAVDRDGTGRGYDCELIARIRSRVSIPIIAHGGAGVPEDAPKAVAAGADGVCLAGALHYPVALASADDIPSDSSGNYEYLRGPRSAQKTGSVTINGVRGALRASGYVCRD